MQIADMQVNCEAKHESTGVFSEDEFSMHTTWLCAQMMWWGLFSIGGLVALVRSEFEIENYPRDVTRQKD